jgi:hypothetical protein
VRRHRVAPEDSLAFRIGASNREHLIVRPEAHPHAEESDYWDGNWVEATIEIAARGFRGKVDAQLRAEDFVLFRDQLRPLYENLGGAARFVTMEDWLTVEIQGDGKGRFHAACVAVDRPGMGNQLTFGIDFDQTELPEILRGLDAICEAIPVVGVTS